MPEGAASHANTATDKSLLIRMTKKQARSSVACPGYGEHSSPPELEVAKEASYSCQCRDQGSCHQGRIGGEHLDQVEAERGKKWGVLFAPGC